MGMVVHAAAAGRAQLAAKKATRPTATIDALLPPGGGQLGASIPRRRDASAPREGANAPMRRTRRRCAPSRWPSLAARTCRSARCGRAGRVGMFGDWLVHGGHLSLDWEVSTTRGGVAGARRSSVRSSQSSRVR